MRNLSLLYSIFTKLLKRFIHNLVATVSSDVLQVSKCITSYFECSLKLINFTAILLQNKLSRVING